MAKEAYVVAGDREVRVSSPDRVIYEATDRTPEVTKLMVAQYFASVEDGLMRALRERPTALERWTSGVRPGMTLRDASSLGSSGTEFSQRLLSIDDVEVAETEARTQAAVALCVDTSFSMAMDGRWVPMKQTALALHTLIGSRFRGENFPYRSGVAANCGGPSVGAEPPVLR